MQIIGSRITSGLRQECESQRSRRQETSIISPRLRAATHMRFAALGGFESSQARPQQAPLVGAALEKVLPSVAARGCLGTSASPICWGCTRGLEVRGPGRFRSLPGKTSANPTCWGCPRGSGRRWTSASPFCWGCPRDISGPGLLEWLAGLRSGLKLGSGLSPHIGGHNLNEGSGGMK